MNKYIASVSWGKDSLCMLLGLIERGRPLDEVVFYDTSMEFRAIYDTRDRVLPLLTARSLDRYAQRQNAIVYVGIAADEQKRLERLGENKNAPLVEWSVTEAEALNYCYDHGYEWRENGYRLYDLLDRVSCWCCANKNLKELRNYYMYLPEYWERLKYLQSKTVRPMKGVGKNVYDLEKRFQAEYQK